MNNNNTSINVELCKGEGIGSKTTPI